LVAQPRTLRAFRGGLAAGDPRRDSRLPRSRRRSDPPPNSVARKLTETLANELLRPDEIVIGIPLYNFGPPSTFKAWFDRIVVPGLTVDPQSGGLLGGRPLTFTAARGGGWVGNAP